MKAQRRVGLLLPQEVLKELNETVPRGERSRVVAEARRNELARIKFRKALEETFGGWKAEKHPELAKGTRRYVRTLRRSSRSKRLQGG